MTEWNAAAYVKRSGLQEVMAAAFNAILADDRPINVRPWLYRIARNRSLNHLRRTTSIGVDTMDVHFAEGGLSTTDKVLRRENFRELIADVQDLPETQRSDAAKSKMPPSLLQFRVP